MYLCLSAGQAETVKTDDLVGIFDLDSATVGAAGREFLARAQKNGEVTTLGDDLPKSFLLFAPSPKRGQRTRTQAIKLIKLSCGAVRGRIEHPTYDN